MSLNIPVFQAQRTLWFGHRTDKPTHKHKHDGHDGANHLDTRNTRSRFRFKSSSWPKRLAVIAVMTLLSAIGCAKSPEHPWVLRDGLIEIETYNRGKLFVRRDHHLGDYDNLLIDHVGFRYGRRQKRLRDPQEDQIVSMLVSAIRGSQDGIIGISTTPGPCVLTVNFFVKDLEFEPERWEEGSVTNSVSSYGAATMVLELRDSLNQEPLARFIQRRDLGGGRAASTYRMGLWRLRHVLSFALRDMGNELRKIIPPTTQPQNTKCRGGMSQIALGAR